MKQHTIQSSFAFEGKGLHTGLVIHSTFLPAEPNTGIRICRTDLEGRPTYEALAEYVSATERGTVLEYGRWKVSTVEHALSALYAMHVDNCLIEVDGPEVPILDGSSILFVEAIRRVGIVEQDAKQKEFVITNPIDYKSENGNRMTLLPAKNYQLEVQLSYPDGLLKDQKAVLLNLDDYAEQIARARTFCFVHEIKPLLDMGLIKGGDLDNALVIDNDEHKYLNPLIYDNEPARHKLLDVIGDLALLGCRIRGRVITVKPGHTFNTACCRQLRNLILQHI